jgi:hypothetical protein
MTRRGAPAPAAAISLLLCPLFSFSCFLSIFHLNTLFIITSIIHIFHSLSAHFFHIFHSNALFVRPIVRCWQIQTLTAKDLYISLINGSVTSDNLLATCRIKLCA